MPPVLNASQETFWLRLFGSDFRFVGALRITGGSDHVDMPIARIARTVARMEAAHLHMTHNHPSGDPRPSLADISATRLIWKMARTMGITLQDHVILGDRTQFSFRDQGLL